MKALIHKFTSIVSVIMLTFFVAENCALAEDVEIYTSLQSRANVLFILDQSESMLQTVGSTGLTRDQVVKNAFQTVMSQNYQNLNVGFMDYGRDNGAGVDLPVADINQPAKSVEPNVVSATETYASMLSRFVNNLEGPQPNAQTALVEALLEGAKYYRGDVIDNLSQGFLTPHGTWDEAQSTYAGAHWRAAGPRTFSTGATTPVAGSNCHAAGSPAGAPYSQCVNPFPGTCTNKSSVSAVTHQHGTFCPVAKVCTLYDSTGTECITYSCPVPEQPNPVHSHPYVPAYTRCKQTSSTTGKAYISPIQTSCDRNFIVLLSDGGPTILGSHEQTSIQGFSGITPCTDLAASGFTDPSILLKGKCGPDLTKAISENDLVPSIPNSTVTTHTIGFQLGGAPQAQAYLQKLADDAGGQFFNANSGDPTQLVTILQNLLNALSTKPKTVSTPVFTIDLGNPLTNRPEVFFSKFSSLAAPRWPGNVKGYFLTANGFEDIDGNSATDANGEFVAGSRSFWTATSDGADVTKGGVADNINPSSRIVKTDDGSGSLIDFTTATFSAADASLFNLPGSTTEAELDALTNWARGVDVDDENADGSTTDARKAVGDPLHPIPIVAQYTSGASRVLYFMTNEGYLHAVDVSNPTITNKTANGGDEIFAYMPRGLLKNLDPLRRNVIGNPKIYGLDGPLSIFQVGGPLNAAGDKYLYFGMRRGGRNYYSLDVSTSSNPSLRWEIQGGTGNFVELAQTWSRPVPIFINDGGTIKDAVLFGGGYDSDQDANTVRTADDVGRAVYIVDASDGSLLWAAGGPDDNTIYDANDLSTIGFDYSVPGGIAAIDTDRNGVTDRLYFGDMGGQLWRIDVDDINTADENDVYKLADLASDASTTHNRRFYTEPSVTKLPTGDLGIVIGSGYRAHPLNGNVEERLYMIYDRLVAPTNVVVDGPASNANAVADITLNTSFDPSQNTNGWKLEFPAGEKIMASIRAVDGILQLSTYIPPTQTCQGSPGQSRVLAVDLNGKPQVTSTTYTPGDPSYEAGNIYNTILWGDVNRFLGSAQSYDVIQGMRMNTNPMDVLQTRFWLNTDVTTP